MRYLFFFLLGGLLFAQEIEDPLITSDWEAQEKWVDSVYTQMSSEEKIGQLFMVMAFSKQGRSTFKKLHVKSKNIIWGALFFLLGALLNKVIG